MNYCKRLLFHLGIRSILFGDTFGYYNSLWGRKVFQQLGFI
jgi:hypothetical protein